MKTLLAAALIALPLATLAGDEQTPATGKTAAAAPAKGAEGAKGAAKPAEGQGAAKDGKAAKVTTPKQDAPKKDEKPCEPVKPCSID